MILEGVRPADVAKHRPWIAVARPIHDAGEIRASLGRRRYKTSKEAVRPEDRGIEPAASAYRLIVSATTYVMRRRETGTGFVTVFASRFSETAEILSSSAIWELTRLRPRILPDRDTGQNTGPSVIPAASSQSRTRATGRMNSPCGIAFSMPLPS